MEISFEKTSFLGKLKSMLKVDFRRLFTSRLFYILVGACLVMPILILVMTTMMDGTVSTNPQTGEQTVMEGFKNTWQIIGSVSNSQSSMNMDITSMCNLNMLYFFIAVLVCIFVSDDFRSGYCKNLFTVRAKRTDYVTSKTLTCFVGGAFMIVAFIIGSLIGGAISNLPFTLVGFNLLELILCLICKVILVSVFVPIYLVMSVIAKEETWLSMILSFCVGMFLFMMISITSPLNASIVHVVLCLAGGVLFSAGLGIVSVKILQKTRLV